MNLDETRVKFTLEKLIESLGYIEDYEKFNTSPAKVLTGDIYDSQDLLDAVKRNIKNLISIYERLQPEDRDNVY